MVLVSFLAFIVLSLVGFYSFEIGRSNLAQQQLQNAVDAAALAAVATLASEDNTNPTASHNDAIQTALNLFKQNVIMGTQLTNTTVVGTTPNNPPADNATLYFEFLDPITHVVQPLSSPNGKLVCVQGDFGLMPAFGTFLGLGQFAVHALSNGAVPQLDIVLCFDISGSMDDQTPVTAVKREWDPALNKTVYQVPLATFGTNGTIYNVDQPGATGTTLNGGQPQGLSWAMYNDGLWFSEVLAGYYGIQGLRSGSVWPEKGQAPGNCPPGTAYAFDGSPVYTDLVVNLDGNTTFGGITSGGYNFPDVGTLLEASRGNLEDATVFASSKANTALSVSPQAGYQAKYFQLASALLQPINDAKAACTTFTNIINTDTDAHFSFVAFDSAVGTSPTDTEARHCIDDDDIFYAYPYGPWVNYPRPMVPLDPTAGGGNYGAVNTAINSCVAIGSTNIGVAVQAAVNQLTTNQRPGACRAIVLFTDGQPTLPAGPLDPDPWQNARDAAVLANNAGIPVFTIGLAQNAAIVAGQTSILNDTNPNPTSGGIAAISGHGATFNLVTNSSQLTAAFEKIARCLVELEWQS
jgi:hypothetical protein